MATTAKKTSTKKTVKKTTKPATATKKVITKKVVTKKTPVKKTTTIKKPITGTVTTSRVVKSTVTPIEKIRSVNLLSAVIYGIFAVLTVLFVSSASAQAVLSVQVRDTFTNNAHVVLAPASEVLFSIQFKYILATILGVSAIGSLLLATKLRARYEAGIKYGTSGFRWLLMGISAGLTLEFVSFMAGITDVATLKTIGSLIIATTVLGWLAERENTESAQPKWLAFTASLFTGAMAWAPLVGTLIGTTIYGEERYGWHIYALSGVILAGFTGFAVTQYMHIKKKSVYQFAFVEQRYLRIDQIIKFAVVLIIFSSLAK